MAAKLTILTHKIAIQLHLVAKSCTICRFAVLSPGGQFGNFWIHPRVCVCVCVCVSVCTYVRTRVYSKVSGLSRTEITATTNTRWEATQRIMAAKLTRLTHKIAMQLHLVAESCTICSSLSRQPARKLLDTLSYMCVCMCVCTYYVCTYVRMPWWWRTCRSVDGKRKRVLCMKLPKMANTLNSEQNKHKAKWMRGGVR
jgi:hypothetical protein